MNMESKRRAIVKAMSYRGMVTAILAALSWTFTASADQTTLITVAYAILATIGYYGHERVWNRILWGTIRAAVKPGANSQAPGPEFPGAKSPSLLTNDNIVRIP
jgi:uncharacterized membrane protein